MIHITVHDGVVAVLDKLHDTYGKSDIQTIRGGTQVGLKGCPYREVTDLITSIEKMVGKISEAWSIRMTNGGHHVDHNHPDGKLSGVYYLRTGKGGNLKLGDRLIVPEPGMLVLFPSWMIHGTTTYEGDEPRLTVAFDIT